MLKYPRYNEITIGVKEAYKNGSNRFEKVVW